ncbi:MAG: NADH-quinone oxidoreductase subunit J [Acidimicrobiia bacterium]|nr:NADH-quinone oxidoreductase subunit J [Acidimicrobiia bacterium]NNF10447.1 NADH-quinone oxidoreductase subunit J [Acidimicrobiia bacterium]NNL69488.1 NADH-quinone oxidoreductase subunit J [Acidimicrobiia bacterium]
MAELVIFVLFGVIAIAGALTMVLHPNPVYGALGLMATMLSIAVFYVVNSGHFIAAVQVVVYAGAVMTLFLFVIMMIGVDRAESLEERLPLQRQLAIGLGVVFLILIGLIGGNAWITAPEAAAAPNGTVENIADLLFTDWLLPFEVTTLLLIIASVGAVALAQFDARRRGGEE